MIDINKLYLLVNNDIARKDHAGYTSTDEFNRQVNVVQNLLFDFYIEKNDARAMEPLRPFVTESYIPSATEYYPLPSDYRQQLEVGFEFVTGGDCDTPPTKIIKSADLLSHDEVLLTSESPIRSQERQYSFIGGDIKISPADFIGNVYLKYYRYPVDATRGFILDVATQEEVYDIESSVNLEWDSLEMPNLVDLMLIYKGISVRNTEIIQWAMGKQSMELKTAVNNDERNTR